jgi:cysteine desulfurase
VNPAGIINLEELRNSIKPDTILITVMFANNEIGTIQPIKEISKIAKENNIVFHTDAVQAVGNVKINVEELGIDMLSMSAHKFYGPKGMGALYVKEGIEFERIQDGGHQENNKRAGTENVAGIVGIGKAIEIANLNIENYNCKLKKLKNYFINEIITKYPEAKINGDLENRLPGNINISFPNVDGEELLLKLDNLGICASAGSACSSGLAEPSHVLLAIGLEKNLIEGTLRFTLGEENTIEDMQYVVNSLLTILSSI